MESVSAALFETSGLKLTRSATAGNMSHHADKGAATVAASTRGQQMCMMGHKKTVRGRSRSVSQGEISAAHTLSWRESLIVQLAGKQTVANAQA